LQTTSFK